MKFPITLTFAAAALAAQILTACTQAPSPDSPDGEDPAINGGELTPEALANKGTPTGEGDILDTGEVDVPILPEFALPDEPGKLRTEFKAETDAFTVNGTIDPRIAAFDVAIADQYMRTIAQSASNFAEMGKTAKAEADAAKAAGEASWFPSPYDLQTHFAAASQAGNLISIYGTQYMYTGGAHGNSVLSGETFQKGGDVPESIDAFISDRAALTALVVEGIASAKIERGYEETERGEVTRMASESLAGTENWTDNFVLNASTLPGKFGGLTILFSPYEIGSYAEGSYEITIPASKLAPMLTADRAGLFGGEPAPLPPLGR
jgi:hypothetical protein